MATRLESSKAQGGGGCIQTTIADKSPEPEFAQDQGGFDSLGEADLVGQDGAAVHSPENQFGGVKLMGEGLESQPGERHERVEARARPDPQGLIDQL